MLDLLLAVEEVRAVLLLLRLVTDVDDRRDLLLREARDDARDPRGVTFVDVRVGRVGYSFFQLSGWKSYAS